MEYGFETGTNKCAGKFCLNRQAIKNFDDAMTKATTFGTKLRDSSIYAYRRASCHPEMREKMPTVQWFWQLFPFNLLAYFPPFTLCSLGTDLFSFVCCWCLWIPWQLLIVLPWNVTWMIILGGSLAAVVLMGFGIGSVLSFCLAFVAFGWLSVQGAVAIIVSFFGFLVMFFTTSGFAIGGTVVIGPFAFVFMVIAAFISTLGF